MHLLRLEQMNSRERLVLDLVLVFLSFSCKLGSEVLH